MKRIVTLACAALSLAGMAGCGGETKSQDPTAPTVVKYSVVFASSGTQADGAHALAELIKEHSQGRLEMQFYPSAQLGDKVATFEGLQNATIEMTECALTDLSAFNSMWAVFSLPYLWEDGDQAIKTIQDPAVRSVLEQNAEENGFKIIAWTDLGARSFVNTRRPINTPADLSGLKMRVMEDAVLAAAVEAMGAIATPLPFSEVYTGMQQGTIDGADYQIPNVLAASWQEICKYMSMTEHFIIPDVVFVSKAWFDRLSPENQAAILAAGEAFTAKWNEEIWANAMDNARQKLIADGMSIIEVDKTPFAQAVEPVVNRFIAGADEDQKKLYELITATRQKY